MLVPINSKHLMLVLFVMYTSYGLCCCLLVGACMSERGCACFEGSAKRVYIGVI